MIFCSIQSIALLPAKKKNKSRGVNAKIEKYLIFHRIGANVRSHCLIFLKPAFYVHKQPFKTFLRNIMCISF